jgi:hypothetical protein
MIERVDDFQAHENERRDRQIDTKMHDGLAANRACGPRRLRGGPGIKLNTYWVITRLKL